MGGAQVGGHVLGVVQVGDGCGEVVFAGEQDVLGAAGEVGLVFLGQRGHGKGVPADKAGTIFQRFEKLDSFKEGTGIGLNICALIADGLKGEVKLDQSYAGGARFLFTFPC